MPEQRGREYHRNRVQETLREEIAVIIDGELSDPRIGSTSVTEVTLEPGGKSGHVYIAVLGEEADEESTLEGLRAAKGYIRAELLERMGTRHIPDLSFHIDRSERINARMDTLLTRMKKREARRATGSMGARQS